MEIKLLGYGEIGKAVANLFRKSMHELTVIDPPLGMTTEYTKEYDFVLVCIPYTDDFMKIVLKERQTCNRIVVFTTVPVGTVQHIPGAVHIPIEGRHPYLNESLQEWPFFIGYNSDKYLMDYVNLFREDLGKEVITVRGTKVTELTKILSTTLYGVNLEFYRYVADTFKEHDMECDNFFALYGQHYNAFYQKLKLEWFQRYILRPPVDDIGGHCVRENAKFLDGLFPDIVKNRYTLDGGAK